MKTVILLFFVYVSCSLFSQNTDADKIIGKWWTEEKRSVVEIFKKDNFYYGKIIYLKDPNDENGQPKKDTKNPNEKYRDRPIKGLVFMFRFQYNKSSKKWEKGKIYDPESGNTYDGYIKFKSVNILELRGYMGITLLGRTSVWTRYVNK